MNSKRSKRKADDGCETPTGKWVDVGEGIKPGETKEIAPNFWATNVIMVALDPPEPIKKRGKSKTKKK